MNTEVDRKIAVILVADVVGYSKHMERDENSTLKAYAECEKILKTYLKKFKGSIFNTAGDSALVEFPSAVNAVECGVGFQNEIKKRNITPTKFLPLWDLLGVGLGFGSTLLGKKAAMLCTASVEEVIDEHYLNQINQLDDDEKFLKNKITKFREDELNHKDIAYEKGATKKGPYSILDKIIKTGSKIAINISEKI